MEGKTIMEVLAESSKALNMDQVTIHEIESLALPKVKKLTPKQILELRKREKVSQNVMAKCLNVCPSTYQKWERGEIKPNGGNLKLLNLVKGLGINILLNSWQYRQNQM